MPDLVLAIFVASSIAAQALLANMVLRAISDLRREVSATAARQRVLSTALASALEILAAHYPLRNEKLVLSGLREVLKDP